MRIIKGIVGWICFLSLLTGLGFGGLWLHDASAPFFEGGAVYTLYPRYDPSNLPQRVLAASSPEEVDALLRKYALEDASQVSVAQGWEGFAASLVQSPRVVTRKPESTVVAIALVGGERQMLGAYPGDVYPNRPLMLKFADWEWTLRAKMGAKGIDASSPLYYPVLDRDSQVATLAVFWLPGGRQGGHYLYVPSSAQVPSHAALGSWLTVAVIALALYVVLLPIWVAFDAAWCGMRPYAWGALVVVTGIIGLLAYVIARLAPPRPCPNCGEAVLSKYMRCPACGVSLLTRCPVCGTKMKAGWQYCPVCIGANRSPDEPARAEAAWTPPPADLPQLAADGQTTLSVTVRDAATCAGVQGASVMISGPTPRQGLTNRAGVFEARSLAGGEYQVTASKDGCAPAEAGIVMEERTRRDIALDLTALPGRVIGRVMDRATTAPAVGVQVYLDSARLEREAVTAADGSFVLDDVLAGPYTVCAEGEGYVPQTRLVEIGPGKQVAVDFVLDAAAVAAGEGEAR